MSDNSEYLRDIPTLPYPYNEKTNQNPVLQRLQWVLGRLPPKKRPALNLMLRKLGHRDCEGNRFILAVPTNDANCELVYYSERILSDEFVKALPSILQDDL